MNTILRDKKSMVVFILASLMVSFLLLTGFVYSDKKITVIADGTSHTLQSHQISKYAVVAEAGITLNPNDELVLSTSGLQNGTVITVKRAIPVTVELHDQKKTVMTTASTAQELMNRIGFAKPYYVVIGNEYETLKKDSLVKVGEVTNTKKHTATEVLDIETIREPDPMMAKGQEKVVQEGEAGSAIVTRAVYYDGANQIGSKVLESMTIKEMVPRIIKEGTRDNIVSTSRGVERYRQICTMNASAYTVAEGNGDGLTATGMVAKGNIVAVDPNVIPLGTRVYIPGYGHAIAADTGGAIVGNRIDLLMETVDEAMQFGRRTIEVYILE